MKYKYDYILYKGLFPPIKKHANIVTLWQFKLLNFVSEVTDHAERKTNKQTTTSIRFNLLFKNMEALFT